MRRVLVPLLGIIFITAHGLAQSPRFDVVSIKKTAADGICFRNGKRTDRPNGSFTRTNWCVSTLILEAYPSARNPKSMVGLPAWADSDGYDLQGTSTLGRATQDDRVAMMRALLADRFKLAVHFEKRDQDVFELVVARSDGRLGPGLKPVDLDCVRVNNERPTTQATTSGGPPPDRNAPPPPCTFVVRSSRSPAGELSSSLEGSGTMDDLASWMIGISGAGRVVVNRTSLAGSFAFKMNYDTMSTFAPRADAPPPSGPTVVTALQEQLGLKLQPSRAPVDTLVIDHLERPTED